MRFVKITFTGKVKDGKVFDTTDEKTARDEGVFDEQKIYAPQPVLVGEGGLIKGLEQELAKMKAGEQKQVEIPPEKAYGERTKELMRLVPLSVFKKQKITPVPGMPVQLDGMPARVQTVAGGRVRVDFNHELAGKTLVFNVKLESEAKTPKEKGMFLAERNFTSDESEVKVEAKKVTVKLPEKLARDRTIIARKASFAAEAFKHLNATEMEFTEVWKKEPKGESDDKTSPKD